MLDPVAATTESGCYPGELCAVGRAQVLLGVTTHVTRDRDPRGDRWVAPLWWTDGVGQADPSHLRLRRT